LLLSILPILLLSIGCKKSGGSGTTTTTTSGDTTKWDWTGTPPLSVIINGTLFQAALTNSFAISNPLTGFSVLGNSATSDSGVSVSFTSTPSAGSVYSMPSPANAGYTIEIPGGPSSGNGQWEALSGGAVKILSKTDSTIEGLFYASLKDPTNMSTPATLTMTKGYFKVKIK